MHYVFLKKKVSTHYVPTTRASTMQTTVAHGVHEAISCLAWGAPPCGLKTCVREVVEPREAMKVGLRELVQGIITIVLAVNGCIACRKGSLLCGPKKGV